MEATPFKPIEVFFRFDTDANGKMDFEEFQGAISAMRIEMTTGDAEAAFIELDDDSTPPVSSLAPLDVSTRRLTAHSCASD